MSNRQRTDPMIPPSVADAEAAIANLTAKRDALVERGNQLASIRASVAYKALNDDDAVAKQKLDQINKESVSHSHELASVDAALVTARQKLEAARRHEAKAADRQQALAIRQEWTEAAADFTALDQGLNLAADAARRLYERYGTMQRHGFRPPPQLTLMLADVVVSALMAMPKPLWQQFNYQGLEYLPPNRRRSAASLRGAWGPQVERHVQQQLGSEPATPEAA
jgi:hypothetical protein